jgi:hypothetical protein
MNFVTPPCVTKMGDMTHSALVRASFTPVRTEADLTP